MAVLAPPTDAQSRSGDSPAKLLTHGDRHVNPYSNPYAPPQHAPSPGFAAMPGGRAQVDLQEALRQLQAFLANPNNVAGDRRTAGGRFRPVSLGVAGVGAFLFVLGLALAGVGSSLMALPIVFSMFFLLIGGIALIVDVTIPARGKLVDPATAVKAFYRALQVRRHGYAWTCLGPLARGQTVPAPDLTPVKTKPGYYPLAQVDGFARYAQAFCNPQVGLTFRCLRVNTTDNRGDFAEVAVEAISESYPMWALLFGGWLFYLIFRKRRPVSFRTWMIRGQDGLWYFADGNAVPVG